MDVAPCASVAMPPMWKCAAGGDRQQIAGRVEAGGARDGRGAGEIARRVPATCVASSNTGSPASRRSAMARATTSRGASSASGWIAGMNRRPDPSSSTAPAPRSASVRSGRGSPATSSAVGWNCTNSRSESVTPRRAAAARPAPRDVAGFVVRSKQAPIPPVARTTCGATTARREPSAASSRTPPRALPAADDVDELEPLQPPDVGPAQHGLAQGLHDGGAGAVAAGMHDPVAAVTRFATEQQPAHRRPHRSGRPARAARRSGRRRIPRPARPPRDPRCPQRRAACPRRAAPASRPRRAPRRCRPARGARNRRRRARWRRACSPRARARPRARRCRRRRPRPAR